MSRTRAIVTTLKTDRPAPFFIADARGLDFLNSTATPGDEVVEWIGSGADLVTWLARAKLVPDEILAELRGSALPGEFDAVAARARALRERARSARKRRG